MCVGIFSSIDFVVGQIYLRRRFCCYWRLYFTSPYTGCFVILCHAMCKLCLCECVCFWMIKTYLYHICTHYCKQLIGEKRRASGGGGLTTTRLCESIWFLRGSFFSFPWLLFSLFSNNLGFLGLLFVLVGSCCFITEKINVFTTTLGHCFMFLFFFILISGKSGNSGVGGGVSTFAWLRSLPWLCFCPDRSSVRLPACLYLAHFVLLSLYFAIKQY